MTAKTKTKTSDIYGCTSCNITSNNTTGRMCPCPRGGCEAEVIGKIITTTETILFKKNKNTKSSTVVKRNKMTIGVEEMDCTSCGATTGHTLLSKDNQRGKAWTCTICGNKKK